MIDLDILDDDIRYAAKKSGDHFSNFFNKRSLAFAVLFVVVFFWVFLVLPGRVAAAAENAAAEFARACNAAVAAAIVARSQRLVELADDGGDGHFVYCFVLLYLVYLEPGISIFFIPLSLEAEHQKLWAEAGAL